MAHSLSTPQTASSVSPCFTGHGQSKLKKQGGSDIALPTCLPIIMADPLLQAVKSNFTLLQEVAANPLFPLSITIRGGGGGGDIAAVPSMHATAERGATL